MGVVLAGLGLTACTPSGDQLKKAIEKDPSIVFAAIEKDPDQFIEVVNKAAGEAQQRRQAKAQEEEKGKRDAEFANPLKPEIQEGRAIWGPADAAITIVEYSDFECPFCQRGYNTIQEVKKAYPGKIRLVFKHMPLDFHPNAMPGSKYFEAIARQSSEKAYKFHDEVFVNQKELRDCGQSKDALGCGDKFYSKMAKKVGADLSKLKKDLADASLMDRINKDMEEARSFGMTGTPGFVINGVSLKGAFPFPEFKTVIDRHLGGSAE